MIWDGNKFDDIIHGLCLGVFLVLFNFSNLFGFSGNASE